MPSYRFLLTAVAVAAVPAHGQIVGKTLTNGVTNTDLAAIGPVVQGVLRDGKAGTVRPWQSANGQNGNVRLLSGGAAAGDKCGRVRISSIKNTVENRGYVFKYCRDPHGTWRVAG